MGLTDQLAIHSVTRDSHGRLAIDGESEAIDWLLEMRRFADEGLFEHLAVAGRLDASLLMRLVGGWPSSVMLEST